MIALALLLPLFAPAQRDVWRSDWPETTRTWISPSCWGCRLQDWKIADGRLLCVEARERKPMRVCRFVRGPAAIDSGFKMSVTTGAIDDGKCGTEAWHGFLIGTGTSSSDWRRAALTHHRPAEDGGLVVAVDGTGRIVFRDFEKNVVGGAWGIGGKLHERELAELAASQRSGKGYSVAPAGPVTLTLAVTPAGTRWRVTATATDPDQDVLSHAVLENVEQRLVDGWVGLVSHRGPAQSQRGYWFRDWTIDGYLPRGATFGPLLAAQYTVTDGVLKLTAQAVPLGTSDPRNAALYVRVANEWQLKARAEIDVDSFTFSFRVHDWDASRAHRYRVGYGDSEWLGTIRADPGTKPQVVVAAFTGTKHFTGGLRWNANGLWFPHEEVARAVTARDPDLLFFSGDQVYEGDITGAQRRPADKARLDYLDKWYRWCVAFGDLARDRPCVCIPDDHDVYHGNVWGAGGRHAKRQDDGGYRMPARFVNMVQRTQTSHLPDPFDPRPVEQGISVYYSELVWGGLSFAILEDRKWKSSPTVMCPEGKCINGWFRNPNYDPAKQADVDGAVLLGSRQLAFLKHWAESTRDGVWAKCALSQTIFANLATLPTKASNDGVVPGLRVFGKGDYAPHDKLAADGDSNGWPQSGRNRALRLLQKANAFHIAGDQHLASFIRYGIDNWDDATHAFCVPSIGNTFPRRWFPPESARAGEPLPGKPAYTGHYLDGFGNKITVHAVANPVKSGLSPARLHDRSPGFGIVRFTRADNTITAECWRRSGKSQYPGWPIRTLAR